jgi:hypothetical protein
MKQFVQNFGQNLKIFEALSGRFLSGMLIVAAATFNAPALADSDQGAVVTHIDRHLTGYYVAVSPDGQLRLDIILTGLGDFFRLNPDGTVSLEIVEPKAPLTASILGSDGNWVPTWGGSVSFHSNDLVEQAADGSFESTFEAFSFHVEGKLTNLIDGSKWSLQVVAVVVDYQFKELKIDLHPR